MGIYARGKFWWKYYEKDASGRSPRPNASTKILVDAPTPQQKKQNKIDAEVQYQDDLRRLRQRIEHGPALIPITFAAYGTWYVEHVSALHRGRHTARTDGSTIRALSATFGPLQLVDLTPFRVQEWIATRATQVKAKTVARELSVLKTMLSKAIALGHLAKHPLHNGIGKPTVSTPRGKAIEARAFTRDEFDRFIAAIKSAPTTYHTPRAEGLALAYCALDTLVRRESLLTLTWQADKGTHFHILNTKTAPVHKARITKRMRVALDALPKGRPGDYIFGSHYVHDHNVFRGESLLDSALNHVYRWFVTVCQSARVTVHREKNGVTFHSFRHTGATWLLERGFSVRVVQQMGGWSTLDQVQRYCHTSEEQMIAAAESLGSPQIVPLRAGGAR